MARPTSVCRKHAVLLAQVTVAWPFCVDETTWDTMVPLMTRAAPTKTVIGLVVETLPTELRLSVAVLPSALTAVIRVPGEMSRLPELSVTASPTSAGPKQAAEHVRVAGLP